MAEILEADEPNHKRLLAIQEKLGAIVVEITDLSADLSADDELTGPRKYMLELAASFVNAAEYYANMVDRHMFPSAHIDTPPVIE